ncbi:MAG: PQQ-dependent sugar dehydrogenase [Gaiella sp.]
MKLPGPRRTARGRPALGVVLAVLLVVAALGAGGAAVCTLTSLQCRPVGTPGPDALLGKGGGTLTLPPDLRVRAVAAGIPSYATDFAELPDGRLLIAEKTGVVRLVSAGRISARPFLDLTQRVATRASRGLVDVTVDPDFRSNHLVYVVYTLRGHGTTSPRPTTVRVSRFSVEGDIADPASEHVLVGSEGSPVASLSCSDLPATADCLPSDVDHIGADIAFAPDGSLFVSTGDGGGAEDSEQQGWLAQDVDSLAGKILRVDRQGRGLPDNPYWNGDADVNRSKVWATGLRNPFRLSALSTKPVTLAVGDVGWRSFDEVNLVRRGQNLGWPCLEASSRPDWYEREGHCRSFDADDASAPWLVERVPEDGYSVIGGVSLSAATALPERYRGSYVFGDWGVNRLYIADLQTAGTYTTLAENAGGPVAFAVSSRGTLLYLAANLSELREITAAAP